MGEPRGGGADLGKGEVARHRAGGEQRQGLDVGSPRPWEEVCLCFQVRPDAPQSHKPGVTVSPSDLRFKSHSGLPPTPPPARGRLPSGSPRAWLPALTKAKVTFRSL